MDVGTHVDGQSVGNIPFPARSKALVKVAFTVVEIIVKAGRVLVKRTDTEFTAGAELACGCGHGYHAEHKQKGYCNNQ